MSNTLPKPIRRLGRWLLFCLLAFTTGSQLAQAGLTVDIHLYHDTWGYYFYPWLTANPTPPNFPVGDYLVASPQFPTNGSTLLYQATPSSLNFGINGDYGGGTYYSDFDTFLQGITNGAWSIWVTNSTSTNQYTFTVSVSGITSNLFGAPVAAVFPADGAQFVPSQPLFQWTGPANWAGALNVSDYFRATNGNRYYEASEDLPPDQTSWPCPVVLPDGTNDFSVDYTSNVTAFVVASTPRDNASHPISGWTSTATLETHFTFDPLFTVGRQPVIGGGHRLAAHYTFDDSGHLGQDSSGNGNDMSGETYWGPQHQFDTPAMAGDGAVRFFGTDAIFPYDQVRTNLNGVLAGSFSFSTWVNTTVTNGADYNNAFFGAVIFWAFNNIGSTNDTIPLSITGSKAAFTTRDHLGNFGTLHSLSSVNDGNYHLITVTRDQATGEKKIFVDGNFETSEMGTTDPLNGNNYNLTIGGEAYCTDGNCTNFYAYNGLLDDLQVYSGVLSADEIAALFRNPGSTAPDVSGSGLQVHYDFDEGAVLAADVSGNGNPVIYAGTFGGAGPSLSTDAVAGVGSVAFDGGSYLTAPSNLLSTIARDFSVSLWVKTSQTVGSPGDMAYWGAVIVSADLPTGGAADAVPIALTAGQVAFNTGDGVTDDTLNSSATVNDDAWHHLVVTRDQSTGEKQIFVDGVLDASELGTTGLLDGPQLLTIGAKSDASDPAPSSPDSNGSQGYEGLLDDLQIYSRVLSTTEVSYLFSNPGATIGGGAPPPYPVDLDLALSIARRQELDGTETYIAFPSFNSLSPAPTTTNFLQSPNGMFVAESDPASGFSSSWILQSLGAVLNEWTNGLWTLYINQGSPTQQVYTFSISVLGLDTNVLQAARILSPANGSLNVATNPAFTWSGPSNYSTLDVDLDPYTPAAVYSNLPVTATNWTGAPTVGYGTNIFEVTYDSNDFPNVTFTTPVGAGTNSLRTWTTHVTLQSSAGSRFVVTTPAALPVRLTILGATNGQLHFSFTTQAGRSHVIQSRTNLISGTWADLTNFTGDGSLQQFSFPTTNAPMRFFRVKTN